MNAKLLSQIIPAANGKDLEDLLKVFKALEGLEDLFAGFIYGHGNDNRFLYVSPYIETITGHPAETFQSEAGFRLFYSITPPEYRAHIVERSSFYIREAKQDNFSTIEPHLIEINGALCHLDGTVSKIRFLGMVLEYTAGHDFLFSLGSWQKVDSLSEIRLVRMTERIYRLLAYFKEVYVRIHPDKYRRNGYLRDAVTKVLYPLYEGPVVTKKEYLVLQLISNGYSSKQIAQHLNISFHTAETHRKHLLGKFEAVNSAELMKKASKVFWFE